MKCINFGEMARDRIAIQSRTEVSTDYGGQSITWGDENTVWAIIEPATGREVFAQEQLQSRVTHKITIRYISTYKDTAEAAKRRISFDGRIFSILYTRNLHEDMKRHGQAYQQFYALDNGEENDE